MAAALHRKPARLAISTYKKASTLRRTSESENMRMLKQHCQSPRGCRDRVVAEPKNDAVQPRRADRRFEVEPVLLTCAQGWGNEHGGTQGRHGDQRGVLDAPVHPYLESRSSCMAVEVISWHANYSRSSPSTSRRPGAGLTTGKGRVASLKGLPGRSA